ncbi:M14 family zinc carboxypeptidase [Flavobacterium ponti]|uniref:M14 family zinc carboxypeptidase n=1 Tax=Flavobacterium ponti TaxID=665133 RepID=A0ABV9P5S7_9FLAO
MQHEEIFSTYTNKEIKGRHITNESIEPILNKLNDDFKVKIEGKSVLEKPIYSVQFGHGKTKIYMWSQMHGDEATCTKAIIDFFELVSNHKEYSNFIQSKYTLYIVPLANPDGAEVHTRENINKVDLNRDVQESTQPESKILKQIFENFQPHYCLNMHDQRTIYGVGDTDKSAIISFLAPAYNVERDINEYRSKAMYIIGKINNVLQTYIPGHVGRYNDAYCDNCFGDYFASKNAVTILFEAGHHPNDYMRDITRKYIFISLLVAFDKIHENVLVDDNNSEYFKIPDNKVSFFDILYKNVKIIENGNEKIINFASQYKEVVKDGKILFEPYLVTIENDGQKYFGHIEYDLKEELFSSNYCSVPVNDVKSDFLIGKNKEFIDGILKQ